LTSPPPSRGKRSPPSACRPTRGGA
jgi:hypothetical protein